MVRLYGKSDDLSAQGLKFETPFGVPGKTTNDVHHSRRRGVRRALSTSLWLCASFGKVLVPVLNLVIYDNSRRAHLVDACRSLSSCISPNLPVLFTWSSN